ncbi:hypothetical protein ACFV9W_06255 [Streptomyces sp. NPDC059897]|uniref:hypothetical protein n=1 Tax=Streptomyces sp. NPDC059897 TaxID=3346994 RepID=UPI00364AF05C
MRRVLALGAVLLASGVWVGCAEWPTKTPSEVRRSSDGPIELDDGRRVTVAFTEQGLVERHQGAEGGPWSKPRVLHPAAGDSECDPELTTYDNTVAVMADWDYGCYGDAAEIAIVAVSDGDLDEWDTHGIENIDGWEWTRFSWSGYRVVFRKGDGDGTTELNWRQSIGFTGPDVIAGPGEG